MAAKRDGAEWIHALAIGGSLGRGQKGRNCEDLFGLKVVYTKSSPYIHLPLIEYRVKRGHEKSLPENLIIYFGVSHNLKSRERSYFLSIIIWTLQNTLLRQDLHAISLEVLEYGFVYPNEYLHGYCQRIDSSFKVSLPWILIIALM